MAYSKRGGAVVGIWTSNIGDCRTERERGEAKGCGQGGRQEETDTMRNERKAARYRYTERREKCDGVEKKRGAT